MQKNRFKIVLFYLVTLIVAFACTSNAKAARIVRRTKNVTVVEGRQKSPTILFVYRTNKNLSLENCASLKSNKPYVATAVFTPKGTNNYRIHPLIVYGYQTGKCKITFKVKYPKKTVVATLNVTVKKRKSVASGGDNGGTSYDDTYGDSFSNNTNWQSSYEQTNNEKAINWNQVSIQTNQSVLIGESVRCSLKYKNNSATMRELNASVSVSDPSILELTSFNEYSSTIACKAVGVGICNVILSSSDGSGSKTIAIEVKKRDLSEWDAEFFTKDVQIYIGNDLFINWTPFPSKSLLEFNNAAISIDNPSVLKLYDYDENSVSIRCEGIDVGVCHVTLTNLDGVYTKTISVSALPVDAVKINDYTGYNDVSKRTLQAIYNVTTPLMNASMSNRDKVKVVHDWLVNHVQYDYDNYTANTIPKSSYGLVGPMLYGKSVCQGYAYTFEFMMNVLDIPCYYVSGAATNSSGSTGAHGWNKVYLDGAWYYIDTTWDDPVTANRMPVLKYDYYLSKTLWSSHRADSEHITKDAYINWEYILGYYC